MYRELGVREVFHSFCAFGPGSGPSALLSPAFTWMIKSVYAHMFYFSMQGVTTIGFE